VQRVNDLQRRKAGIVHAVEEPLARAEQDRNNVEPKLVDRASGKRLADGGRAAGDVDLGITGNLARLC
jgi:hypothetical protein